jgi:3-hydroxybutyryl-CoA dehydrogenase
MFEGKHASREDIDAAMRVGCGYPMGPLALLDLIGLDTAYEILDTMYKQGRDRLHAPAPVLGQMVTAGLVGRKAGRGFYTYEASDSPVVVADALTPSADDEPQLRHDIRTVGVVGNGTMATGIVEVFVKAGFDVTHVADSTSLDDLGTVDIVVEAVAEDLALKTALFENLDGVCKPGAILATTTSSLPVISLAKATSRPQDVIGVHFFEPVPVKELVEIVSTVSTSSEVAETARALGDRIGKVVVSCGDRAGSVVNALLFPYLNDAVRMLEAHYATADDIDTAMKHGCALPTGPFELLDMVGNDVALAIQRRLYLEFREPGFAPAPLLGHLVMAGHIGRETGRGFRDHSGR